MKYLALGDSTSIDKYTSVAKGGAASQLARALGVKEATFLNLTRDGQLTHGVLEDLSRLRFRPDVVTLTIGGNDFLKGRETSQILSNIRLIANQLAKLEAVVVTNTIYDPTDGNDELAAQIGLTPDRRLAFEALNRGIKEIAATEGFLVCDLEVLFRGHGMASKESWIVLGIEPNFLGATAIARAWKSALDRQ